MNESIRIEIQKFEDLQKKYSDLGAQDSDSEALFHMLIARAVSKDPANVGEAIDWDLYDDEGRQAANDEMTKQGWKVYVAVQTYVTATDIEELMRYCWRADPEEFAP